MNGMGGFVAKAGDILQECKNGAAHFLTGRPLQCGLHAGDHDSGRAAE
jgi:hypothetical protein